MSEASNLPCGHNVFRQAQQVFDGTCVTCLHDKLTWLVNSLGATTRTNQGGAWVKTDWDTLKAKVAAVRRAMDAQDLVRRLKASMSRGEWHDLGVSDPALVAEVEALLEGRDA